MSFSELHLPLLTADLLSFYNVSIGFGQCFSVLARCTYFLNFGRHKLNTKWGCRSGLTVIEQMVLSRLPLSSVAGYAIVACCTQTLILVYSRIKGLNRPSKYNFD